MTRGIDTPRGKPSPHLVKDEDKKVFIEANLGKPGKKKPRDFLAIRTLLLLNRLRWVTYQMYKNDNKLKRPKKKKTTHFNSLNKRW